MKYESFMEELKNKGIVPGLSTITNLLHELGNPQDDLRIVHIAGTNGKGSIFAYLASMLQEAGYRVGRYISPTILCYEERFQIDGVFIKEAPLEALYEQIEVAVRRIEDRGESGPTLFEAETALAFLYFKQEQVDYALIECGMGGLQDATNVIAHPVLSVIASISFDHMAVLGDTLAKIAFQKAGIIKPGVPVVGASNPEEVQEVIRTVALANMSTYVTFAEEDYEIIEERNDGMTFVYEGETYETCLPGLVQAQNAVTAILAGRVLGLDLDVMKKGIRNTRWPGRLELLAKDPMIYRDGAHNPDAAKKLSLFLQHQFSKRCIRLCLGILKDKDYTEMLSYLVPLADKIYTFTPQNKRGLDGDVLRSAIHDFYDHNSICNKKESVVTYPTVNDALRKAKMESTMNDVIVVCGSLSFMEEMEEELWK